MYKFQLNAVCSIFFKGIYLLDSFLVFQFIFYLVGVSVQGSRVGQGKFGLGVCACDQFDH